MDHTEIIATIRALPSRIEALVDGHSRMRLEQIEAALQR